MSNYFPTCGDVGFVGYEHGYGFITDAISYYSTGRGEAPTSADHQFQVLTCQHVLEAGYGKGNSVALRSWGDRMRDCAKKGVHFIVFRPELTENQMHVINTTGRGIVGVRYGYAELLLQAIDGRLRKLGILKERRAFATKLGLLFGSTLICSGAGNTCLHAAGVLPKASLAWAPDDTFDEAVRRGWRIVAMDNNGAAYWGPSTKKRTVTV